MRLVRVPDRYRNTTSWLYLAGLVSFWDLARLLQPGAEGTRFAGLRLLPCPLKAIAGIPCPFCGLTTGCAWLARGEWHAAWQSNILSPVLLTLSVVWGIYTVAGRILAGRAMNLESGGKVRRVIWLTAGLLTAASWSVNLFRRF